MYTYECEEVVSGVEVTIRGDACEDFARAQVDPEGRIRGSGLSFGVYTNGRPRRPSPAPPAGGRGTASTAVRGGCYNPMYAHAVALL